MDTASRDRRQQLTRDDWVRAALAVIAADGYHALSVDGLAKRIGVTRGSFYWHFADRAALVEAALAFWEQECTRQIISDLGNLPTPLDRLRSLLVVAFTPSEISDIEIKFAEGAGDALIRDSLARVTSVRLDAVRQLFTELGFAPHEAATRARLMYAAYLGYARALTYADSALDTASDIEVLVLMLTAR